MMGLLKCADSLIGIPGRIKGISGGEMKRLAFASEVLTNPSLLFCDEPTSSLDAFMAQSIVSVLRRMAASGRTIICTIHQPSSSVFDMFDQLLLMAEGRVAYIGSRTGAMDYFARQDLICPENFNPSDFYIHKLAIVPGKEEECKRRVKRICDEFKICQRRKISQCADDGEIFDIGQIPDRNSRYKASWCTEMAALMWRSFLSLRREPLLTTVRLAQNIVVSCVLGAIFWQQQIDLKGIMNINGAVFLIIGSATTPTLISVINTFCSEVAIVLREHGNGLYRLNTYFLSKTLTEVPVYIVLPLVFTTIAYWSVGLRNDVTSYLICVGIILLVTNTACSCGYFISCMAGSPSIALPLAGPIIIPMALFGGLFLNTDSIPRYFIWLKYLSWHRYANEALLINQWSDFTDIICGNSTSCPPNGDAVLHYLNFKKENFYFDVLMLVVLLVGFRCLAFFALFIRMNRKK